MHPPVAYFNRLRRIPWRKLLNVLEVPFTANDSDALRMACPFHDSRPSDQTLDLKPDGTYHCWKCDADGDLFQFVQRTKYRGREDLSPIYAFFSRRFDIPSFYLRPEIYE